MARTEKRDKLNARVTDAILQAEKKTQDAKQAWQAVADLESGLSLLDDIPIRDPERQIAARGVWTASLKVTMLEALNNC